MKQNKQITFLLPANRSGRRPGKSTTYLSGPSYYAASLCKTSYIRTAI